jgi:hypothetical protein
MPHRSGKRTTALRPDHGWSSVHRPADLTGLAPACRHWLVRTGPIPDLTSRSGN